MAMFEKMSKESKDESVRIIAVRELAILAPSDIDERYALAQQCRQEQAFSLERRLLEEIVLLAPEHAQARQELGFQRFGDRWVTENELHELRGDE